MLRDHTHDPVHDLLKGPPLLGVIKRPPSLELKLAARVHPAEAKQIFTRPFARLGRDDLSTKRITFKVEIQIPHRRRRQPLEATQRQCGAIVSHMWLNGQQRVLRLLCVALLLLQRGLLLQLFKRLA